MATRRESYKLQRVTLNLRDGDFDQLRMLHGRLGASKVIRELVIGHLQRVDYRVSQTVPAPNDEELR